mgnify:CR=1 FL=1
MTNKCLSLVVHGGAGAKKSRDYSREIAHMRAVVEAGREALRGGASALEVVQAATRELVGRAFDRAYDPMGIARQITAIASSRDRTPTLGEVRVPAIDLHGADAPLIAPSGGEATARAIPDAELHVIPGMGHDLPPAVWPRVIDALVTNATRSPR